MLVFFYVDLLKTTRSFEWHRQNCSGTLPAKNPGGFFSRRWVFSRIGFFPDTENFNFSIMTGPRQTNYTSFESLGQTLIKYSIKVVLAQTSRKFWTKKEKVGFFPLDYINLTVLLFLQ